jgi:xanthine/CO dehydrogenase XdhC/CoxF family maturation factor
MHPSEEIAVSIVASLIDSKSSANVKQKHKADPNQESALDPRPVDDQALMVQA